MDKEYKTMSLEDTSNWKKEDFDKAISEYQRRRNLTSNLTPKKKNHRGLKALLGIGLLLGGTGLFFEIKDSSVTRLYKNLKSSIEYERFYSGTNSDKYNLTIESKVDPIIYSNTEEKDMLSQSDAIDRVMSNVEVFSDVTVGDIVGGSIKEFAENTAPEDMVKEITKGTVRELSKEVLETGKETVQEVLSNSDVSEAVSGVRDAVSKMGENLQNLLTNP